MDGKIFAVTLFFVILLSALPAGAMINATGVEIRGAAATGGNFYWTNATFAGFFYDLKDNLGKENLTVGRSTSWDGVLNSVNRTIAKDQISYSTIGEFKYLQVVTQAFGGNGDVAIAAGLEQFGNGSMAGMNTSNTSGAGQYTVVGWQGEAYAAIKKKPYKLSRVVIEQGVSDWKNLTAGQKWVIGGGWNLTVKSINASATPINVTFFLTRDGVKKNDTNRSQGQIYTYVESNVSNETDVPMFVTYINNITASTVQFKYTWALSTGVTQINSGDKFGVMKVVQQDPLMLRNTDNTVTLSPDVVINLMGELKFKVADDPNNLRYYPFVEKTQPGIYEVRGSIATGGGVSWTNATFSGFFYDFKDNLGMEYLSVITEPLDATNRTIAKNQIWYSTYGQPKYLQVVDKQYNRNVDYAIAHGLEQFANGSMAGITGVSGAGQYTVIGWQGEKYVAIKKKSYKLTKLLLEQTAADEKTLIVGEPWELGEGWVLTAKGIDARASPRQVWFTLSKDGMVKDEKILTAGTEWSKPIYTYVEKSLCGETDVPVFVTYVDSVFAGETVEFVQVRYTWLLSSNCTEIMSGDKFGVMTVTQQDPLRLMNTDTVVTLAPDTIINLMGELKFKVADDAANLRYYPFVVFRILQPSPVQPPQPFDTLNFKPKAWNFVSVPRTLVNSSIDAAFRNLSGDVRNVIYYYNATSRRFERPSGIMPLRSYWVYNNASKEITQKLYYRSASGPVAPPSMLLRSGWNMIGHSSTDPMPVPSALVSIDGKYSNLFTYDPVMKWKRYIVGDPGQQQFNLFYPGRGYWVFMKQDATYASVDV